MDLTHLGVVLQCKVVQYLDGVDVLELSCTCRALRDMDLMRAWLLYGGCARIRPYSKPLGRWVKRNEHTARAGRLSYGTSEQFEENMIISSGKAYAEDGELIPLPLHPDSLYDLSALANLPALTRVELISLQNISSKDLFTLASLPQLAKLTIRECNGVTDLEPLRSCMVLQELRYSGDSLKPSVSDVSPLSSCKSLRTLRLWWCANLSDIGPLSSCLSLRELELIYCHNLIDIRPLEHCTELCTLEISSSRLRDIGVLTSLQQLHTLSLSGCKVLDSILPLSRCQGLRDLVLSYTNITDLTPLTSHPALTSLDISLTDVTDFGPLASLSKLQILTIGTGVEAVNIPLTDIGFLEKCTVLTDLRIRGYETTIPSVAPVASCVHLEKLSLYLEDLVDITALVVCEKLRTLVLRNCRALTELAPLGLIRTLESLRLDGIGNSVADLSPLRGCSSLRRLRLRSFLRLSDISGLKACSYLQELYITICPKLIDIGPLRGCLSLQSLTMSNCPKLSDIGPLGCCRYLLTLTLSETNVSDLVPLMNCASLNRVRVSENSSGTIHGVQLLRDVGVHVSVGYLRLELDLEYPH